MPKPNARCRPMPLARWRRRLRIRDLQHALEHDLGPASGRASACSQQWSRRPVLGGGACLRRGVTASDQRAKTERRHTRRDQPPAPSFQSRREPSTINRLTLRPGFVCHAERVMHKGVELPLSRAVAAPRAYDWANPGFESEPLTGCKWQGQRLALDAIRREDPIEVRCRKRQRLPQLVLVALPVAEQADRLRAESRLRNGCGAIGPKASRSARCQR